MSKRRHKKNGNKHTTENIVLITVILELINTIMDIIEKMTD